MDSFAPVFQPFGGLDDEVVLADNGPVTPEQIPGVAVDGKAQPHIAFDCSYRALLVGEVLGDVYGDVEIVIAPHECVPKAVSRDRTSREETRQ